MFIKSIIFNNSTYTDTFEIASIFNDYFCSIGEQFELNIPTVNVDPCEYLKVTHSNSMFLEPVSSNEVEYHLRNLKNSKQTLDSVSVPILKANSNLISTVYSEWINYCFHSGYFPKILKKAIVIPIYKNSDHETIS